jgi:NTE family protein
MNKKKIGLVLGGGGARGFAHFGLLKVFEQSNIHFDMIAGTSMGGLAAAAWASQRGMDYYLQHIDQVSKPRELIKLLDPSPQRRGLVQAAHLNKLLERIFSPITTFSALNVPLILNAVDVKSGKEVQMTEGDLLSALMATTAVPGIFPLVEREGRQLIDGGVLNNLPVDALRAAGADVIIAVDVQYDPYEDLPLYALPKKPRWVSSVPSYFLELYWAEIIMTREMTNHRLQIGQPELVIRPPIPPDLTAFLGFTRAREAIDAGETAAINSLPNILALIGDN